MRVYLQLVVILCLLMINQALFSTCAAENERQVYQKLGLTHIKSNVYKIPHSSQRGVGQVKFIDDASVSKAKSVKYRLPLKKGLFPDLCIRWISPQLGYGVFANEPISKDQLIGEYLGVVDLTENLKNFDYSFVMPFKFNQKPVSLDAFKFCNDLRFVNHSDQPNVYTSYIMVDGELRLIFHAATDIKAGQQLFINYGKNYWLPKKRLNKKLNLK